MRTTVRVLRRADVDSANLYNRFPEGIDSSVQENTEPMIG
jgi:hypothetical protein